MKQEAIFELSDKFEVDSPFGQWITPKTKHRSKKANNKMGASTPHPTTTLGDDYYAIFEHRLTYLGTDGGSGDQMRFVSWKDNQMFKWSAVKRQLGGDLSKVTDEEDLVKLHANSSIIKVIIPGDASEADFFEDLFDKGANEDLSLVAEHAVDIYFDPKDISFKLLENQTSLRGHNFILGRDQKVLREELNRKDVLLIGNVHTHNAADNYDKELGKENNKGRLAETQRKGDGKAAILNRIAVFSIDSESIIKHPPYGVLGMTGEAPIGEKVTEVTTMAFFSGKTAYSLIRDVVETATEKENKNK